LKRREDGKKPSSRRFRLLKSRKIVKDVKNPYKDIKNKVEILKIYCIMRV